ncbi:hypothetical protein PGQ11_003985 [Apiospora arundinis]|uniref:Uncharacterized protein n=1 Tax=Apiospora arundinis TaxID=335852 RepID=A0ABR2J727_9PEZI
MGSLIRNDRRSREPRVHLPVSMSGRDLALSISEHLEQSSVEGYGGALKNCREIQPPDREQRVQHQQHRPGRVKDENILVSAGESIGSFQIVVAATCSMMSIDDKDAGTQRGSNVSIGAVDDARLASIVSGSSDVLVEDDMNSEKVFWATGDISKTDGSDP